MRPLIIGQAPGPRTDPAQPLSGRCGRRLADLCGLTLEEFLTRFDRVNLIPKFPGKAGKGDRFPIERARREAFKLVLLGNLSDRYVVLLGANVARTFGVHLFEFHPRMAFHPFGLTRGIAAVPHPSGVNRWWNDEANLRDARLFWRSAARLAAK